MSDKIILKRDNFEIPATLNGTYWKSKKYMEKKDINIEVLKEKWLGKINNITQKELKNILGNGNVEVTLALK